MISTNFLLFLLEIVMVCIFIKYNDEWDSTSRYVGGEMKGILTPLTATYIDLIELVGSVNRLRSQEKTIDYSHEIRR